MILFLSCLACALSMVVSWLLSQGWLHAVYITGFINGLLYAAINLVLAAQPGQEGILLLAIPSLWGSAMCVVGIRRLATTKLP